MSAAEIAAALPHLRTAEVHAALAYHFDHPAEIDADVNLDTLRALSDGRLETPEA